MRLLEALFVSECPYDEYIHCVELTHGFYVSEIEIMQAEYESVIGAKP